MPYIHCYVALIIMKIVEQSQLVKTSDVVQIQDSEKGLTWFICIEKMDGKFQEIREMVNPEFLREQGTDYMQKVYDLAYNAT